MSDKVKNILEQVLSKSITIDEGLSMLTTGEELADMNIALLQISANLEKSEKSEDKPKHEVLKYENNGQWRIEKAIKPGPEINYSKQVNPKKTKEQYNAEEAAAPTWNKDKGIMIKPKWAGMADETARVRDKVERQMKEPAIDTIKRRQSLNKKGPGVLIEDEASEASKKKMLKDESEGDIPQMS